MLSTEELKGLKSRIVSETEALLEPVDSAPTDVNVIGEALLLITRCGGDTSKVGVKHRKRKQLKRMIGQKPWMRYRKKQQK
jgi:hypothetical protein